MRNHSLDHSPSSLKPWAALGSPGTLRGPGASKAHTSWPCVEARARAGTQALLEPPSCLGSRRLVSPRRQRVCTEAGDAACVHLVSRPLLFPLQNRSGELSGPVWCLRAWWGLVGALGLRQVLPALEGAGGWRCQEVPQRCKPSDSLGLSGGADSVSCCKHTRCCAAGVQGVCVGTV